MIRRTRAIIASIATAAVFSTYPAFADSPAPNKEQDTTTVAAQFFRAGRAAYDRQEYRAAALAFLEAYRRVPRAAAIYDAARAWEAAGEVELAADAFARALPGVDLAPEDVSYVRAHLDALSAPLAVVHVTAPTGSSIWVRNQERGPIPISVHLAPGSHEIHVHRKDGSDISRTVVLTHAGETIDIAFDDVAPPPRSPPPPPPAPRPLPESHPPILAWVTIGVAAAAAVGGVITYDRFTSSRSTFEASGDHDTSAHDDAQQWRTTTYVLWGGAVALGALGGVLLATTSHRDRPTQGAQTTATLRASPGAFTFTLTY